MANQIIPLTPQPNQQMLVTLNVNNTVLRLNLTISFNEIAQTWHMQIADVNNNILLTDIPLITGSFPAANILAQYQYLLIGSAYVLNISNGATNDYPNATDLGSDFALMWSDNV